MMPWRNATIAHCKSCDGEGHSDCAACHGTGTASGRGKEVFVTDQLCRQGHVPGEKNDPLCMECNGTGFVHIWRELSRSEWTAWKAGQTRNLQQTAARQAELDGLLATVRAKAVTDPTINAIAQLLGLMSAS
jgi:DnaJ-class molecular chaperone